MKRKSKLVRAFGKMLASIVGAAQYRAYVESYLKAPNNCTFRRPISTFVRFKPTENLFPDSRLDFRRRLPQILPGMRLLCKFVPNSDQFWIGAMFAAKNTNLFQPLGKLLAWVRGRRRGVGEAPSGNAPYARSGPAHRQDGLWCRLELLWLLWWRCYGYVATYRRGWCKGIEKPTAATIEAACSPT